MLCRMENAPASKNRTPGGVPGGGVYSSLPCSLRSAVHNELEFLVYERLPGRAPTRVIFSDGVRVMKKVMIWYIFSRAKLSLCSPQRYPLCCCRVVTCVYNEVFGTNDTGK